MKEFEQFAVMLGPIGIFGLGVLWLLLKYKVIGGARPNGNERKKENERRDTELHTLAQLEAEQLSRHKLAGVMGALKLLAETNTEAIKGLEKSSTEQTRGVVDIKETLSKEDPSDGVPKIYHRPLMTKTLEDISEHIQEQTLVLKGLVSAVESLGKSVDKMEGVG